MPDRRLRRGRGWAFAARAALATVACLWQGGVHASDLHGLEDGIALLATLAMLHVVITVVSILVAIRRCRRKGSLVGLWYLLVPAETLGISLLALSMSDPIAGWAGGGDTVVHALVVGVVGVAWAIAHGLHHESGEGDAASSAGDKP